MALGRPVVLVGHSYAGAVISQTGSNAGNVAGLVYVAAYAPEAGETLGAINARYSACPFRLRCAPLPTTTNATSRRPTHRRRHVVPRRGVRRRARRGRGRHAGAHAAAGVARRLRHGRHRHAGVEDQAILGGRGHCRSGHRPPRRARHGQASGKRHHRDRRLARGRGDASRGRRMRPGGPAARGTIISDTGSHPRHTGGTVRTPRPPRAAQCRPAVEAAYGPSPNLVVLAVHATALPSSARTWPREGCVSAAAATRRSDRRHTWPPSWV